MDKKTVGFIGFGNMAQAIASGILAKNITDKSQILAYDKDKNKLEALCAMLGIIPAASNEEIVQKADVIILAVKPNILGKVLAPLYEVAREKCPTFISIAAGTPIARIENMLGQLPIVRVMPNINAQIGESMSAICANNLVSQDINDYARDIFSALGRVIYLEESLFGAFMAVSSASAAFVFMFIEALARGGLKAGMNKNEAVLSAAQAVMGSAKLMLEKNESPGNLIDKVTSPGGTTIAGISVLEDRAFIGTVMQAVEASIRRDEDMAKREGA